MKKLLNIFSMIVLNLQRFAQAGTVTNVTNGTTNAYTGAHTTTTAMSPTMKTYYDTELLENTRDRLIFQQLGKVFSLPENHGMTMEWRKFNTLGDCERLQEAVIPEGTTLGMTSINVEIAEYGKYFAVSRQLDLHAVDDVILGGTEELGAAQALTYEKLIRGVLATNTNVMFADVIVNGAVESTPATRAQLITALTAGKAAWLTVDILEQASANMLNANVPFFSGQEYVAVVHPDVAYDIMRDPEWQAVKEYSPEDWMRGEIGRIGGIRFIRSPLAPVFSNISNSTNNGNVYQTLVFGKDAFGVVDPQGAGVETIIKTPEQVGGPLNQFSTVGTKFSMATKILYPERLLIIESGSRRGKKTADNMGPAAA